MRHWPSCGVAINMPGGIEGERPRGELTNQQINPKEHTQPQQESVVENRIFPGAEQNGPSKSGRLRLEFKNEGPLDQFSVLCSQNGVPFAQGVGLSISMPKRAFQELPQIVRSKFLHYEEMGEVSLKEALFHSGKRRVLTTEESREALRKIIPEKFLPKQ